MRLPSTPDASAESSKNATITVDPAEEWHGVSVRRTVRADLAPGAGSAIPGQLARPL